MRKELLVSAMFGLLIAGCVTNEQHNPKSPYDLLRNYCFLDQGNNICYTDEQTYTAENVQQLILTAPKLSIDYQALAEEINTRRKVEIAVATNDSIIANPRLNPKSRKTAQKIIDEYVGNVEDRAAQKGKEK